MPWVKIDEAMPDHPKVLSAGPLAGWLHICGLAYCNRYLTDGFVPRAMVPKLADFDGLAEQVAEGDVMAAYTTVGPFDMAERLVACGIWRKVEGGYQIHDYLDFQPSKAEVEEARRQKQEAGRKGGKAKAAAKAPARQPLEQPASTRPSGPLAERVAESKPDAVPDPDAVPEAVAVPDRDRPPTSTALTLVAQNSVAQAPPDPVVAVFDAWRESTGKHRAQLDSKRRKVIREALKAYPLEDVLAAVRGWRHSAHHRGENRQRTVYNDLALLLRDAPHIELFRDLELDGPPQVASSRYAALLAMAGEQ